MAESRTCIVLAIKDCKESVGTQAHCEPKLYNVIEATKPHGADDALGDTPLREEEPINKRGGCGKF